MQSKVILRIAAVALVIGLPAAMLYAITPDSTFRRAQSDLSECSGDAFRAYFDYFLQAPSAQIDALEKNDIARFNALTLRYANIESRFVTACMQRRGWRVKQADGCGNVVTEIVRMNDFRKPDCYEPATPAGDGIAK